MAFANRAPVQYRTVEPSPPFRFASHFPDAPPGPLAMSAWPIVAVSTSHRLALIATAGPVSYRAGTT